jgi:PAS domain-containing protein
MGIRQQIMTNRGTSREDVEAMREVITRLRKTNNDLHKQIEEYRLESKAIRQNEQRLQAIIERFSQLTEAVNDILVLIRPGKPYAFTYISPAHERLTGRKVSELYENPTQWLSFVHEADRNKVKETFEALVSSEIVQFMANAGYRIYAWLQPTVMYVNTHLELGNSP